MNIHPLCGFMGDIRIIYNGENRYTFEQIVGNFFSLIEKSKKTETDPASFSLEESLLNIQYVQNFLNLLCGLNAYPSRIMLSKTFIESIKKGYVWKGYLDEETLIESEKILNLNRLDWTIYSYMREVYIKSCQD